jgi:hypothetical protein
MLKKTYAIIFQTPDNQVNNRDTSAKLTLVS